MIKKSGLVGLLLFGMFFGAGNLIFPPALGALSGTQFWPAILGFVLSGVGLAVLALIVGTVNPKGYVYELSRKIGPGFATLYLVALYLSIGPFFAIPRTATTAYEVGIAPMLGKGNLGISLFVFTLLYFGLAYLISLNPSKILDRIGRLLTPIFAALIVLLIILGAVVYAKEAPQAPSQAYAQAAFGQGFLEGYNTLDALASVAFSVVAVSTMQQLGFASKKDYLRTIWLVGLVVALLFSLLYIGLGFLGNHFPIPQAVLNSDANKGVYVLSQATQAIFGPTAQIFLAVMVTVTCFTTTAGLIVSTASFFHKRFPGWGYRTYATLFSLIGFGIANLGLNAIIAYSLPVLQILYPITIAFVMILCLNHFLPLSQLGMRLTIALVVLLALADVLGTSLHLRWLQSLVSHLPLAQQSLAWLLPALVMLILAIFLPGKQKKSDGFSLDAK
ncbi:branched-chain amino acid transport system II carrier protein [Streptococcus sp. DD12]|uniref:branched-chain amino acid transport system II carrier protein n=1 Tax=Streptococcus sp. DD12 TaxID=1777880 RepID=UPI000792AD41|nr:branched-chain amino acid transport system II carrier protein [Streptococcus sp. DD12]KXT75590.1 Branched-chain amino acid transport system carrier protein [Streptococcus sp. DD12]